MAAGTRLSDALVEQGEVDIAAGGAAAWMGEPGEQALRMPVLAGQYLEARHVTAVRAVQAGEAVVLVHREGALEVRRDAAALQEGDVGTRISVRPALGTAAVMARVTAPGTVELVK
jgi:flagella basal body P-ring formation protein FlgA